MAYRSGSARKMMIKLLAVSLGVASPVFAQETQGEKPQPPKIIRKSGGVLQGSATKRVEPAYPPLAKAARISGSVVVEVTVDEEGTVIAARAISGHPLLKDSAVAAARGWTFAPTKLQGEPVKVIGTINFKFTLGDAEEIERVKQQVIANPNSADLYYRLGNAYRLDGQVEMAVEAYNKALRLQPDYAEAYSALGSTYKGMNDYEKALEAFKQALDLRVENAEEVLMEMARTLLKLDRSSEALESAQRALELKHDFIYADEAHALVGLVRLEQGRYNEALEAFKEAAKISPGIAQVHLYLGMTYVMMGDQDSAMDEYRILKVKDSAMAEQLLKRINKH
jgi:TonB family protein